MAGGWLPAGSISDRGKIMQDKVIIITGASSGIGAALAELVGAQGGRPVLLGRRREQLEHIRARSGPHALGIVTDVTRREAVMAAFEQAVARFGQVDVWVNNAGRGISRMVSALTDDDVDEMLRVNVKSALYGMQTVLPHFRARGRGHIINVSSMLGRVPFAPFRSAYSAAKAALNTLTANLRMELGAEFPDIHVSTVHPGVVATDFGTNALHGGVDSHLLPNSQSAEEVAEVIAELVRQPRADVYTRPGAQAMVAEYYAAPDMGLREMKPPFAQPKT
jgi:NAD(P)-dependent dehydrogenase (short-subunit alcohol dehydrogenase family)